VGYVEAKKIRDFAGKSDPGMGFLDGPAFIAIKAQQQLGGDATGLALPIAIKATNISDSRQVLRTRLLEMAESLGVELSADKTILNAVCQVGLAMLQRNLRQRGFMPPDTDWSDLPEVISAAAGLVINGLEAKMELTARVDADLVDRIRAIRREVHRIRTDPVLEIDHPVAAFWAHEAMMAYRILSYAGNDLAEHPTLDRCGETIEKLREDLYSRMYSAHANRAVLVHFGEPIDVSAKIADGSKPRERRADLTDVFEQSVQVEMGRLNANDSCPGAEMF